MAYQPNPDIDIGLHALVIHAEPGQTLSLGDMADVCGCTKQLISNIEKRAMKKLRQLASARAIYEAIQ